MDCVHLRINAGESGFWPKIITGNEQGNNRGVAGKKVIGTGIILLATPEQDLFERGYPSGVAEYCPAWRSQ
jgi:hypothetical protein